MDVNVYKCNLFDESWDQFIKGWLCVVYINRKKENIINVSQCVYLGL